MTRSVAVADGTPVAQTVSDAASSNLAMYVMEIARYARGDDLIEHAIRHAIRARHQSTPSVTAGQNISIRMI